MDTTRTTGKYYSINTAKLEWIADHINAQDATVADIALDQDWNEGDDHQRWLDSAPAAEIADWVLEIAEQTGAAEAARNS